MCVYGSICMPVCWCVHVCLCTWGCVCACCVCESLYMDVCACLSADVCACICSHGCLCMSVCACISVHMDVCVHAYLCIWGGCIGVPVHLYVHSCAYMLACEYMCGVMSMHVAYLCAYMCACMCICVTMCVGVRVCVHTCVPLHWHVHACMYVYASVCTWMYIYMYAHADLCVHVSVHVCWHVCVYPCWCACVLTRGWHAAASHLGCSGHLNQLNHLQHMYNIHMPGALGSLCPMPSLGLGAASWPRGWWLMQLKGLGQRGSCDTQEPSVIGSSSHFPGPLPAASPLQQGDPTKLRGCPGTGHPASILRPMAAAGSPHPSCTLTPAPKHPGGSGDA
uniref:Uncharacterized protein n=1 Tax=Falco tinnunculus TaxID=100819 RepID=A0A8C4UQ87_FALTI